MKLVIELNLDNDSFKPHPQPEIVRLLNCYIKRINEEIDMNVNFADLNGNSTGYAAVIKKRGK